MIRPEILVVGLGGVGSWVLELLARTEGITYVVGADFNEEWGRRKVYNVTAGAILQEYYPRLEFARIDLRDVDTTAETIAQLQPRLIFNCATLQTFWVRKTLLPTEIADRLGEAGAGPWVATHLSLSRKLMLAIQASDWQGHVINSGMGDISNAVLAKRGLAPTIGLGNIDLIVPTLRMGVATRLDVPARNVSVYAVMHHYHNTYFRKHTAGAPPYFLRLMVGDHDVTQQFDTDLLLHLITQDRFSNEHLNPVVAASGVKNAMALLRDTGLLTHSPGPQGLPGGYPVRLSAAGAEVVLPAGVTTEQALAINEAGQRADGVERIEDDGTVIFTDKATHIMKEGLGYDLVPLRFDECDERAGELIARFKALSTAGVSV
ncbi:MAG: hypothetical protein JSV36_13080 [Anaerolineae bacterium]|nr:MAG: hypothetical protein JSV36_13080 [Anaerolineae bacterium]